MGEGSRGLRESLRGGIDAALADLLSLVRDPEQERRRIARVARVDLPARISEQDTVYFLLLLIPVGGVAAAVAFLVESVRFGRSDAAFTSEWFVVLWASLMLSTIPLWVGTAVLEEWALRRKPFFGLRSYVLGRYQESSDETDGVYKEEERLLEFQPGP
ncbi:MAG: hypothetical protein QN188_01570 [Armatimonadota bacterium]|nr:hypothetical protein [Armatimonadota bacterium]MDR5676854.1 hypothetical protein [Armatimonadota bacterium]MDR7428956.1 hypothetical protein [Armatimonadota bacterium]MDR7430978.1 hypothetical protein [Armatimonadota bacterium]MDR7460902.1 hypothetical protein [Armatimonadota bacterium]